MNAPDVVYIIQPNDNSISNVVVCYTLYEVEEFKVRYPNCKVHELKYDKDKNCFK